MDDEELIANIHRQLVEINIAINGLDDTAQKLFNTAEQLRDTAHRLRTT